MGHARLMDRPRISDRAIFIPARGRAQQAFPLL